MSLQEEQTCCDHGTTMKTQMQPWDCRAVFEPPTSALLDSKEKPTYLVNPRGKCKMQPNFSLPLRVSETYSLHNESFKVFPYIWKEINFSNKKNKLNYLKRKNSLTSFISFSLMSSVVWSGSGTHSTKGMTALLMWASHLLEPQSLDPWKRYYLSELLKMAFTPESAPFRVCRFAGDLTNSWVEGHSSW